MRVRRGWLWMAILPAACTAYPWLVHAFLVDAQTPAARTLLAALNGLPHAAINVFLLWMFARTLFNGREPLVTVLARRMNGPIPVHVATYTRSATIAWCLFFSAQLGVSGILFAGAPLELWSLFVNVIAFPLVIVMFVAEYLYRIARFPDEDHAAIWKGVEAYLRHTP